MLTSRRLPSVDYRNRLPWGRLAILLPACLLTLSSCSTPSAVAVKPILTPAPASLTAECTWPVQLPNGALTGGQVANYWATDRGSLMDCLTRQYYVVQFYKGRDAQLSK